MADITWDEIIARYQELYSWCTDSHAMMERWGNLSIGLLALIPQIRNLQEMKNVSKWTSHYSLVIKLPDRETILVIESVDNSYVLRTYMNGDDMPEEIKVAAPGVVSEITDQLKKMREEQIHARSSDRGGGTDGGRQGETRHNP